MDNDDLYMIYLNSSNVGEDNNGNPIQAEMMPILLQT